VLDLDPGQGVASIAEKDRLEGAGEQLHHRAREFFLELAARDAAHYLVLPARDSVDSIATAVRERVAALVSVP
jgi:dTMP kinase